MRSRTLYRISLSRIESSSPSKLMRNFRISQTQGLHWDQWGFTNHSLKRNNSTLSHLNDTTVLCLDNLASPGRIIGGDFYLCALLWKLFLGSPEVLSSLTAMLRAVYWFCLFQLLLPLFSKSLAHSPYAWTMLPRINWWEVQWNWYTPCCLFQSLPPHSLSLFRDHSHKIVLLKEVQSLLHLGRYWGGSSSPPGERVLFMLHPGSKGKRRSLTHTGRMRAKQMYNKIRFCILTLAFIIPSLDPCKWCIALNLTDAYFHVHQNHRRFLRFLVNNTHYQSGPLSCLLPCEYLQNTWLVVAVFLKKTGVLVCPNLDDWLVQGRSKP